VAAYILTLDPVSALPDEGPAPGGPLGSVVSWIIFGAVGLIIIIMLLRYYQKA